MEPDLSSLAEFPGDESNGYLISIDGSGSSQPYLSGFGAPDPYVTFYTPAGVYLLVSTLEFGRAKKENRANTASRLSDYDYRDNHAECGAVVGKAKTAAASLADHGVDSFTVPADFPFGTVDALREEGVTVNTETGDVLMNIRAVKVDGEVERIHATQGTSEATMHATEGFIRDTGVADDGTLTYEDEPLTSEHVREKIEVTLLRRGYALDETIITCGAGAVDPHDHGSDPLRTDEVVIISIFPRDKETKYNGDMTRTSVKSEPSFKIREWFNLTEEAFETTLDAIEPGTIDKDVHDAVCNVYEAVGESTLHADPLAKTGFIHNTGHDTGLDVHELSSLSSSGEELRPGHVVTIEPGLYNPEIGGVRIKGLVVVTEGDYGNLAEYSVELVTE